MDFRLPSSTSLPRARPRPRIPPRFLRRPAFSKIHHSLSSPFVSSTVVMCMSSSDSLWLPLEILDATTDFVEASVVHYSVILLKSCGTVPVQCKSRSSVVPLTLSWSTAGFVFQFIHPAKLLKSQTGHLKSRR